MEQIQTIVNTLTRWWEAVGLPGLPAERFAAWSGALLAVCLSALIYYLLKVLIEPTLERLTAKTSTKVDDVLLRHAAIKWLWWLLAAMALQYTLPAVFVRAYPSLAATISTVDDVVVIGIATKLVVEFVKGLFLVLFDKDNVAREAARIRRAHDNDLPYTYTPSHSLKGLQQMVIIVIVCLGVILMVSTLIGKNPFIIISGLGAGAAVLMLVFKDSILGVVAGIQLTANDMLQPGDWICAPKYGANGRVVEVTLATVKVLNWDNTITTIPPYNLITDSFQNYRPMQESGGRRVARSINIDMTSVRRLTPREVKSIAAQPWAEGLEIGDNPVNLTIFRRWLEHTIATEPTLEQGMLHMVRELDPTPHGLPIEIYFFTTRTSWHAFELVQADMLDKILAAVPDFYLRIYQQPTGADLRSMK